ncbi:hypothetical protein EBU99_10670 [bacterium]|nr:hypothetical protein [bacterium]
MRSTQGRKSSAGFIISTLTACICVLSAGAFAASKVKPEIPLGDEPIEQPKAAPAPSKGKAKAPSNKPAHEAEKDPHAAAPAAHGEEKDPHAAPPAAHGEEKDPHAAPSAAPSAAHGEEKNSHSSPASTHDAAKGGKEAGESAHGEEADPHASASQSEHKSRLLEGKVDAATPAKGSGLAWFSIVFIVLAVAIFIFT